MNRISVVICTRDRPDLIGNAVESVLNNDHDAFELVVIDQSRDDASARAVARFSDDSRFRFLHIDRVGLSHAYNFGISQTSAAIVAFTDDDCTAPAGWLSAIERSFAVHSDVAMLYGQTLAAPELKDAPGVLPALPIHEEEKLGRGYGFRVYGMGANFALRRSLVDLIGGFDEALGGGGPLRSSQDFDFQFRAYRADAICLLAPDIWVHHYGIRDEQAWPATLVAYGVGDGAFYFKHVRCGDLLALRLLLARLGRLTLAQLLGPIRKRPSQWPYLRSCVKGAIAGMHYRIDRKKRIYLPAESTRG
ncbi:MAG TPA: glycosyltransferase family A protein [Dehalococcoidia bacterium]|nr:glycosyltransferase family A protein [Dehalococcoidia bacterium]